MNDKDLHTFIRDFSDLEISVPRYQRALRARLLYRQAHQQTVMRRLLGTFEATLTTIGGLLFMKKNTMKIGLSVLAVSVLAAGILAFTTTSSSVSAAQLVENATRKTQQMSPEEVAQINGQWRLDVKQRLAEAKQAKSLRVISADELNSWGGSLAKAEPLVDVYVTYTDASNHRIVIGLDDVREPVFLYDVDAAPLTGVPTPSMNVRTN